MIIAKKRIYSLSRNLPEVRHGEALVFAVGDLPRRADRLQRAGFPAALQPGEAVLPQPFGPVGRFNAEGKYVKHKDRPMETAYRQVMWTRTEWHGPRREEITEVRDVPYKRYPRTFVPPPSVELAVLTDTRGEKLIASPQLIYEDRNEERILHVINLLLELFGECQVLTGDLEQLVRAEVRRLNWEVLPQGRMPWEQLRPHVTPFVQRRRRGVRPVIERRLQTINGYEPEFVAVGRAGFTGYMVFGFPEKNVYVLESVHPDNATYVFEEGWERLSQMTKAEILNRDLQRERIIHREGWPTRIRTLLGQAS